MAEALFSLPAMRVAPCPSLAWGTIFQSGKQPLFSAEFADNLGVADGMGRMAVCDLRALATLLPPSSSRIKGADCRPSLDFVDTLSPG